MVDSDHSMTNGFLLILTLVGASIALSALKQRLPWAERLLEGGAVVVVRDGRLHRDRMERLRIGEDEIMAAARQAHGLWCLEQVRHAVVETSGQISVTPWGDERPA